MKIKIKKINKFNILNESKKYKKVIHIFSLAQPPISLR